MRGSAGQQRVPTSFVANFVSAFPPPEEQQEIVHFLKTNLETLDSAIARARSEIELIREYRTRLVADVVTGQLDVRHLELPEIDESLIESIESVDQDVEEDQIEPTEEEAVVE